MVKFFFKGLLGLILLFGAAHSHAKLMILSSLKPLSLIAQEIAGSAAEVDTLLPATASHHDYPLKVSDYTRLQKADIVLWIGPELESFLRKPIANLNSAKVISAYELSAIHWPESVALVAQQEPEQGHSHHGGDPHIWLDPRNAVLIAQALSARLIAMDGENAAKYRANLQLFTTKASNLDETLQRSLKPLSGIGFAVYHEGFSHFVNRYGLHQLDYVTFTPEQKPGAKHLQKLRTRLAAEGKCLFLEPYNEAQSAQSLADELHLRIGKLDALGAQGATTYTQLLQQMAEAFSACLASG